MMMLLAALSILVALPVSTAAVAQDYPNRPITLIVPYAPGGSASTAARSIADKMSETLGQQFIIDNRPGAGGAVATRAVAKGEPDGCGADRDQRNARHCPKPHRQPWL
jgi:tripartite-type tricarboxylate transporter receptor subunit TctC